MALFQPRMPKEPGSKPRQGPTTREVSMTLGMALGSVKGDLYRAARAQARQLKQAHEDKLSRQERRAELDSMGFKPIKGAV